MIKQSKIMDRQTQIMKGQLYRQIRDHDESRVRQAIEYVGIYDQQLNSGKIHEISIALEKGEPLLKEFKGKFLTSDLDEYLGMYNKLDEVFDRGLITIELVYSNFSDDLIRASQNKEIQNYLAKRRIEDADNYKGFDDLAELCLKIFNEQKENKVHVRN